MKLQKYSGQSVLSLESEQLRESLVVCCRGVICAASPARRCGLAMTSWLFEGDNTIHGKKGELL